MDGCYSMDAVHAEHDRLIDEIGSSRAEIDKLKQENERLQQEKADLVEVLKKWQSAMKDDSFDSTVKQYEAFKESLKLLKRMQ